MKRAIWLGMAAALAVARPAAAQIDSGPGVYQVDLSVDGPIIAVSGAGGLLTYAFATPLIHPSCPCAASSVNAFDRGAIGHASDAADWISTGTVALILAAPPLADWLAVRRGRIWLDDVVVFGEAFSVNGALVTAAKYLTQRPVPRVYSQPGLATDPHAYRSFYSGHTSSAFAALSVASVTLDARYGLTWQPWAVTVAVGGSVAVERVLAGYHFPSDVIVGAVAGTVVGTAVAVLHLRSRRLRLSAFQAESGTGAGIAVAGFF